MKVCTLPGIGSPFCDSCRPSDSGCHAFGSLHHRARVLDDHRVVGRLIRTVDVALVLERAVRAPVLDDGRGDAIAERRRIITVGRIVVRAVAERCHHRIELLGSLSGRSDTVA